MSQSNHDRRLSGYGINLFRNKKTAKIAGVCAGLADQFDISPNVVRWIFFGSLFFLGSVPILLYIIAWFLLAPRPKKVEEAFRYDENQHRYRRKNMFNYGPQNSNRVKEAEKRMQSVMGRVAAMESYVTSRAYRLNKEIDNM